MLNLPRSFLTPIILWIFVSPSLMARTKELIFIRHGESHMNAVYHSNPLNIIYRLSRDREFLKDASTLLKP